MNFACQFGIVHAAQWTPEPGTEYSSVWIRYYRRNDAHKCYDELDDRGFVVGMSGVSAPFDTKASSAQVVHRYLLCCHVKGNTVNTRGKSQPQSLSWEMNDRSMLCFIF